MKITRVEVYSVNLVPEAVRSDAIQSFVSQETPIVRIFTDSGLDGTGYTYTIGTGGSSIIAMLCDHLVPELLGRDPQMIEQIWRDLMFKTHATMVGAITVLSLCAIDTALWDIRCRQMQQPLYKAAGGARDSIDVYSTEGGWLHLDIEKLVENMVKDKEQGFGGSKIKLGHSPAEDARRVAAARKATGDGYALMTDCNQAFSLSEMRQRAALLEPSHPAWIEEPFPADDVDSHEQLCKSTSVPVAVGESIYSLTSFKEYLQHDAADIIQVDVGRVGGITPWLKVAHLAEAFNRQVCPHFLMELHVSLCCAVSNSRWLEYIPQLDLLLNSRLKVSNGKAMAPQSCDLGIDWNWKEIEKRANFHKVFKK